MKRVSLQNKQREQDTRDEEEQSVSPSVVLSAEWKINGCCSTSRTKLLSRAS